LKNQNRGRTTDNLPPKSEAKQLSWLLAVYVKISALQVRHSLWCRDWECNALSPKPPPFEISTV